MATRGHVRDLPSKAGSVDPGDGFSMVYETGKAAARTLGAIARALENAEGLILATDPDREGEAIAWQVLDWLTERDAIGARRVERATFHEVTEEAVRAALAKGCLDMLDRAGPFDCAERRVDGDHPVAGNDLRQKDRHGLADLASGSRNSPAPRSTYSQGSFWIFESRKPVSINNRPKASGWKWIWGL